MCICLLCCCCCMFIVCSLPKLFSISIFHSIPIPYHLPLPMSCIQSVSVSLIYKTQQKIFTLFCEIYYYYFSFQFLPALICLLLSCLLLSVCCWLFTKQKKMQNIPNKPDHRLIKIWFEYYLLKGTISILIIIVLFLSSSLHSNQLLKKW